MGKMSELAAELAELKRCGEVLIGISETLTEIVSGADAEREVADDVVFMKERPIFLPNTRSRHHFALFGHSQNSIPAGFTRAAKRQGEAGIFSASI